MTPISVPNSSQQQFEVALPAAFRQQGTSGATAYEVSGVRDPLGRGRRALIGSAPDVKLDPSRHCPLHLAFQVLLLFPACAGPSV